MKIHQQSSSNTAALTTEDFGNLNSLLKQSAIAAGGEEHANALAQKLRDGGRPSPSQRKALSILENAARRLSGEAGGDKSWRRISQYLRSAQGGWSTKPGPSGFDIK